MEGDVVEEEEEGMVCFLFISSNLARNTFALGARELSLTRALGTPPPVRRSPRSLARSNALRHHIARSPSLINP